MCCSMCHALHVDTLAGLFTVSANGIENVIHNVTFVRPNGIVTNIGKESQYCKLYFEKISLCSCAVTSDF